MKGIVGRMGVFACLLIIVFYLTGFRPFASDPKIWLNSSMVVNEYGLSNPAALVDEQKIAGDPANSPGGWPKIAWIPSKGATSANLGAYINLGKKYVISQIYLRDVNGTGTFK